MPQELANRLQERRDSRLREQECSVGQKNRLSRYGLTEAEYQFILDQQGGCCAICGIENPIDIDHCHVTGVVRGILCRNCNMGLGRFHDDPELMRVAEQYVKCAFYMLIEDHYETTVIW